MLPELDIFSGLDYREYYVRHDAQQQLEHSLQYHRAMWKALSAVICARTQWGEPAILEGWGILPDLTSQLHINNLFAIWLVPNDEVFQPRVQGRTSFWKGATDEKRMIANYAYRSALFNQRIRDDLATNQMALLDADARDSSKELLNKMESRIVRWCCEKS